MTPVTEYPPFPAATIPAVPDANRRAAGQASHRERLAETPVLALPASRPRPAVASNASAVFRAAVPAQLRGALDELAAGSQPALFAAMLAAFEVLMFRYTGQGELLVAVLDGGAHLLRTDVSGDLTFAELSSRVTCALDQAYSLSPGEEELPVRVAFTMDAARVSRGTSKYDLLLNICREESGWTSEFEYRSDVFDPAAMARMAGHLMQVLQRAVHESGARIDAIDLLTPPERAQILGDWTNTLQPRKPAASIPELFERQAASSPDALAVVCEDDRVTYRELNLRANCLAADLQRAGVRRGTPVGVLTERTVSMVASLLAVMKAGGAYVPLDPAYPAERLNAILQDCRPACLIAQPELLDRCPGFQGPCIAVSSRWTAPAGTLADQALECGPEDLAYFIYTSGSTGKPKGVMIEHRSAVEFIQWARSVFAPASFTMVLASTSLCFDLSIFEIFVPLCHGGAIRVVPDILQWAEKGAPGGVTLVNTVPSALKEVLRARRMPSGVRTVNVAGEALPAVLVEETFGSMKDLEAMYNLYGPSEDTTYSTYTAVRPDRPPLIGKPVSNTRAYIVDACGMPAPVGVPGEIQLGGAGLSRGYWRQPTMTAERFVPDPFGSVPGGRLYRTGDLGRWTPEGDIEFLGRLDHQVKVRGHRIELGEIEAVIKRYPGVENAVVVAHEPRPGDRHLAAYVVLSGEAGTAGLREHLRKKLPAYMNPSFLIRLDRMPLTPNGKVDRRKLPVPEPSSEREYVSPAGRNEELLAGIWCEVLGCDRVGATDSFFELGGHSLLAMQVVSRIREVFGVELSLQTVFLNPVLRQLAEAAARGTRAPELGRMPERGQTLPLSFGEQRLYFLQQFDPQSCKYNMAYAARMEGELNVQALERAIEMMIARHDTLRACYVLRNEPQRAMVEPRPFALPAIEAESDAVAEEIVRRESTQPFELERGPLFRAVLIRLNARTHILVLTMHHAISDAWSMELWGRDIGILYGALREGRQPELPALPVQYADYAIWQRSAEHDDIYAEQLAYWVDRLKDAPTLELPAIRQRPPVQGEAGALYRFQIPESLASRLNGLRLEEGATLFIAVLAAFEVLLYRYTGQTDLVVGTPISGRNRVELEGVFGYFLNTLAIRNNLTGNPTFRELLRQVRDVTLEAYAHQDLPFERAVQVLQPKRDLSRTPVFQVALVVQHAARQAWTMPGVEVQCRELDTRTAKFDVALFLTEGESGCSAEFEYSTDLFDEPMMERMASHFRSILQQVVAEPEIRIDDIDLLDRTPEEAGQAAEAEAVPPDPRCVHHLFEKQAEQTPEAIAVLFGDEFMTYRELNRHANLLARRLRDAAGEQGRVAVRLQRSMETVVALVAALKAGAAYVPIDPAYPEERQRFMLEDSGAAVLVTQRSLRTLPATGGRTVICIDECSPAGAAEGDPGNLGLRTDADDLLFVIYTSGSTGRPKGVALPHRAIVNLLKWYWSGLSPAVRILQFAPLCFDVATLEIFSALCSGGTVVMTDEETRHDITALGELVSRARLQQLFLPVVVLDLLAHELQARQLPVPDLRELITAGEQLQVTGAVRDFFERTGCSLHNHYGPSEAHVVTAYTLQGPPAAWPSQPPIGRPISGVRTYIVDASGKPVPRGVPGEILIGGVALARGYWNRPDLTAERFVPDGISGARGARLYRTGDLGRWNADGQIEYLGRLDHQVKIRGHRIELGEIEAVLSSHAAVEQALAVVAEATPGEKCLCAYVVSKPGTEADLVPYLKGKLPDYMVPSFVVPLPAMPLTSNGKVDRTKLPAVAGLVSTSLADGYAAPRTPTEQRLAELWQEILGVGKVGLEDNFFALGGHSLLAMRLASRLHEAFHLKVPLNVIFSRPTVRECAEAIERQIGRRTSETQTASAAG